MPTSKNYTREKVQGNELHYRYTAVPDGTWDDYKTPNLYVRRVLLRERSIDRTTLYLYVKLPWFLKLEFEGRYQKLQDIVKGIANNNADGDVGGLQQKEVDKRLYSEEKDIMSFSDKTPMISDFSYTVQDQRTFLKCMEVLEDVENMFDFYGDLNPGHTAVLKYWLPRKDHGVSIQINIGSKIEKLLVDHKLQDLIADVNDFNKLHKKPIND